MYKLVLCLRYLTTRPIGLVSILSVMLGVAVMIIVNSVMGGFHTRTRQRLHGILADMIVESTTMHGFSHPDRVMDKIREVAGDKVVAMTPDVEVFGMLHYQNQGRGPHESRPVHVVGIVPTGRATVGEFSDHLLDAKNRACPSFELTELAKTWRAEHPELLDLADGSPPPPGIIIGYQIATFRGRGMHTDQFVVRPGQEVVITTVTTGKPKPTDGRFTVVDFFKCDMSEYDSNYVFVPLEVLQKLRVMEDKVTSIQLKLRDYADAPLVQAALEDALPRAYFHVQTWEDKQGPLLQAVKVEVALLNIILFFIIAVAGFGILAIFFMIVVEKTRDIGTLKALGASRSGIMGVFLGYGLALGLIGCLAGTILGIVLTWNINPIEKTLTNWTGYEIFPRDIYYFSEIPAILNAFTVVWINLGALAIAVAACVLPARRAAGMNPVEALRHV